MVVYHGLCCLEFFFGCASLHPQAIVGSIEVPGILPLLGLGEECQGMQTSFRMDHEKIFIVSSMGIFHQGQEVLSSGGDGIKYCVEAS